MPHSRVPETHPDTGHLPAESLPAGNAVPEAVPSAGHAIRLYDPNRQAQNWTEVMRPDQCAVLFRDLATSTPLSPEGKPYRADTEYTCLLFDIYLSTV